MKRYNITDAKKFVESELKVSAIMLYCMTIRLWSFMQVVCDLISSKDGTLYGDKRTVHDPQVIKLYFTNPDLLYQDAHKVPRYGPKCV